MQTNNGLNRLCRYTPIQPEPGVWPNFNRTSYDSIPAISSTVLKRWMQDEQVPARFEYWLNHRWDEARSNALIVGDALDCKVLTPAQFPLLFTTVPPDAPKRPTKIQQQAKKPSPETLQAIGFWNQFNKENEGKTILTSEQMEAVSGMSKSVLQAETTQGVFENCSKAVLVGEILTAPAKAEIDLWSPASSHIIDLKTAADASPNGFGAACAKFGYIHQAIWYLGLANSLGFEEKKQFSWIVVESAPPYVVKAYTFDPETNAQHLTLYHQTLDRMMASFSSLVLALQSDSFNHNADWQPLVVPGWSLKENE